MGPGCGAGGCAFVRKQLLRFHERVRGRHLDVGLDARAVPVRLRGLGKLGRRGTLRLGLEYELAHRRGFREQLMCAARVGER